MAAERSHGVSPWRVAFELLVASRSGGSESVTLKVNAKGEVQPDVTAVRQDGESLLEAYARAANVLRVARAEHSPSGLDLPFQGLPEPHEAEIPF